MKTKTPKAVFSFEHYKISEFSYIEPKIDEKGISIKFVPSGIYKEKEGLYILILEFFAAFGENNENEILRTKLEAYFTFDHGFPSAEIPTYFYRNSIAIVFPYLRAFVTTLTAVANSKPMILPVLNLSDLEGELKNSTQIENIDRLLTE